MRWVRPRGNRRLDSVKFIRSKGGPERLLVGIKESPKNWEIIGNMKGGNAQSRKGKGVMCQRVNSIITRNSNVTGYPAKTNCFVMNRKAE